MGKRYEPFVSKVTPIGGGLFSVVISVSPGRTITATMVLGAGQAEPDPAAITALIASITRKVPRP